MHFNESQVQDVSLSVVQWNLSTFTINRYWNCLKRIKTGFIPFFIHICSGYRQNNKLINTNWNDMMCFFNCRIMRNMYAKCQCIIKTNKKIYLAMRLWTGGLHLLTHSRHFDWQFKLLLIFHPDVTIQSVSMNENNENWQRCATSNGDNGNQNQSASWNILTFSIRSCVNFIFIHFNNYKCCILWILKPNKQRLMCFQHDFFFFICLINRSSFLLLFLFGFFFFLLFNDVHILFNCFGIEHFQWFVAFHDSNLQVLLAGLCHF